MSGSYSQILLNNFKLHANKTAIINDDVSYTYSELYEQAGHFVTYLLKQNIQPGERIAVCLPNGIEFVLWYLACMLGGYTIVPINPQLPEEDINQLIETTHSAITITQEKLTNQVSATVNFKVAAADTNTVIILHSSGTTGIPKGICHSLGSMLGAALAFNKLVGITSDTRMLHALPMTYNAGFLNTLLCPLMAGASIILAQQFNALNGLDFWRPVKQHQANTLWLTPMMLAFLTRINRDDNIIDTLKPLIRCVFVGTAPLHPTTKKAFENTFGINCFNSYGITEGLFVSCNSREHYKQGSVGKPLAKLEIHTRNEQGELLKSGQTGEIFVKTPYVLQGYLNPSDNTIVSPLADGGWLATGDEGYVDEDGFLFITGRLKDLIIRGGVNISPCMVEDALLSHPDITEAVVIGKPHDFWGEEIVACITTKGKQAIKPSVLTAYCRERLIPDAIPSKYVYVDKFPRTVSGKIQKRSLLETL